VHITVTDLLTCPRCGPQHGLVLLADRVIDRRVIAGTLGCPNCHGRYPVRDGSAWLIPDGADSDVEITGRPEHDVGTARSALESIATDDMAPHATRYAGLMGVTNGPAHVVVAGPAAGAARAIAALVDDIEVIAVQADEDEAASGERVSSIRVRKTLPLCPGRLRGATLTGWAADALLESTAAALAPAARLVLEPAPPDSERRIADAGLHVLARQDDTVVAQRR
jgi:uncharacterized protein YbaR (Trm112 family)